MRLIRVLPDRDEILDEIREIDAREFLGAEFPESSTFWTLGDDPELGYCAAWCGVLDPVRPSSADQVVHLTRGFVSEGLRGQGIQGRMISTRLRWGRRAGAVRAQTYTWHDNIASMRSLARAGFLPLRFRAGYIRWEKSL